MKKIYQIIMLCAMGIILASCGGNGSSTNTTSNYEEYKDSMNIALENRDFVKAYRFASKCDMTKAVVSKEAAYVLEEQGEAGLVRIAMIVNEHKAPELYLDLLKMAISISNEQLATKLYQMSDTCDVQTVDYAVTADMEGLVKVFLIKNPKFIEKQNVIDYFKEKGTYENVHASIQKKQNEEKKKIILTELEKLYKDIMSWKSRVPSHVKPGVYYNAGTPIPQQSQVEDYSCFVRKLNEDCKSYILKALEINEVALAKEVMRLMMPTQSTSGFIWLSNDKCKIKVDPLSYEKINEMKRVISTHK